MSLSASCRASRPRVSSDRAGVLDTLVSLAAKEAPEDSKEHRKPVDVVMVVDKSGSMSGEKLELVKAALSFLVEQALSEKDRLGLVTFDSNVSVVFGLTNLTQENKIKCLDAVRRITADSNTNLSGGVMEGINMLLQSRDWAERCGVCVLTDGQANEGLQGEALVSAVQTQLGKFSGGGWVAGLLGGLRASLVRGSVSSATTTTPPTRVAPPVFTFGFGKDATVDLLTRLASSTGGNYYSVLSTEAVPYAFTDALGGLLSVAAQNIEMRVSVVEGATSLTPLTKLPFEQPSPGVAVLKLKDMYSGEHRDVLFRVGLVPGTAPVSVKVDVKYVDTINEDVCATLSSGVRVDRVPSAQISAEEASAPADVEVSRHLVRWDVTQALEEARRVADQGDLAAAQQKVDATLTHMGAALASMDIAEAEDGMMTELGNDLRMARNGLRSKSVYGEARSKLAAAEYSHALQRSNKAEELLDVKSSGFMSETANLAGQTKQTSSAYSTSAKKSLFSMARGAFA